MSITEKDLQSMERELCNSFSKDPVEMAQTATDIARKLINDRRRELRAAVIVSDYSCTEPHDGPCVKSSVPLRRAA